MNNIYNIKINDGERVDKVNENITLIQKKDGLTFGTDAYLLASYMYNNTSGVAVELGGGTGIISLLLNARKRFSKIYVNEIQCEFCDIISRNIRLNNCENVFVLEGDARRLSPSDIDGEADVVFSNPPYMKTNSGKQNKNEYKYIARHEVFGSIDDFCESAYRLLKYGGKFYVVYRPDRLTELILALTKNKLEPKKMTFVQADAESAPSMVLIEAKKGASPSLTLTRPLILYKDKIMSNDAEAIYDKCSFEEFFKK